MKLKKLNLTSMVKIFAIMLITLTSCDVFPYLSVNEAPNYNLQSSCGEFEVRSIKVGSTINVVFTFKSDSMVFNVDSIHLLSSNYIPLLSYKKRVYDKKENVITKGKLYPKNGETISVLWNVENYDQPSIVIPPTNYLNCSDSNFHSDTLKISLIVPRKK